MIRKLLLLAAFLAATPAMAATVRIVVPAHAIARGDTIAESDLTYATVDGNALMSGVATSMDEIKGMQARRVLGAGQPLRNADVRRPIVVTKGQTVTMVFSVPGVEVTAIGRAMMSRPRVLLCDEISLGLAPIAMDSLYAALERIRDDGVSILLVEQNVHRGLSLADRVYVLDRGRISYSGDPAPLADKDALDRLYFGDQASSTSTTPTR